jgi:hypothetical protein
LTAFERWLSAGLLRVNIPPMNHPVDPSANFWGRLKAWFTNPVTWKGMLYLLLKFPLGILNFTVATTVLATSFSLLLVPLALVIPGWQIYAGDWNINLELFNNQVFIARPDPYMIAGLSFLVGVFAAPASLHLLNWMANWQGKLAQAMLGRKELSAGKPAAPAATATDQPAEIVEAAVDTTAAAEPVFDETPEN